MLKTLRTKKAGGFTLVEIMIVVAIIALLASIAVPSFLRARKRTQATRVLEEVRLVEAAKDQWAVENNKTGGEDVVVADLAPFFKTGSHLKPEGTGEAAVIKDSIKFPFTITTVNASVKISQDTYDEFIDIFGDEGDATRVTKATEFWGNHAPDAEDEPENP